MVEMKILRQYEGSSLFCTSSSAFHSLYVFSSKFVLWSVQGSQVLQFKDMSVDIYKNA